jgi:hypothetical protein
MILLGALWVLASAAVGYFGRHRTLGYWGVLIYSIIFSPIAGALALIVFQTPPTRVIVLRKTTTAPAGEKPLSSHAAST